MNTFNDKHLGKRAFIACTGPSLNKVDISKLQDEIVFGLNRGYLKRDINYTYFLVADKLIAKQYGEEISKVDATIFTSRGIQKKGFITGQYVWRGSGRRKRFQTNFSKIIYGGGTVTFIAMELAYYMGIQKLYLIGCDHYHKHEHSNKISDRVFKVRSADLDHFHPDYIEEGDEYFTQNLAKVEESYRLAREAFEADERILLNATEASHLSEEIIDRIGFEDIFKGEEK